MRSIKPVIQEQSYVFTFGKHKGKTVKSVIATDPDYIVWLSVATTYIKNDDIIHKALANLPSRSYHDGGWSNADWDYATGLYDPPY